MKTYRRAVIYLLLFALYLGALPQTRVQTAFAQEISGTPMTQDKESNVPPPSLQFKLSNGTEGDSPAPATPPNASPTATPVSATPISDAEAQRLLQRLPAIKTQDSDQTDFALRGKSLPPPRTGVTVQQPFPAPSDLAPPTPRAEQNGGARLNDLPLEVLRFQPEGEVSAAPRLSITFSQPMVAVTGVEDLAAQNVPVQLSPQPPGRWRWLDTQTLLFEPTGRFPMATLYRVSVPAGTKAASGATLKAAKTWQFSTPPPSITAKYPENQVTRHDTLIFIAFDQAINPSAVLPFVRVKAGNQTLRIRLATQDEINNDGTIKSLINAQQPNRWLVVRAVTANGDTAEALPVDSAITVSIGAGASSAEGPRTTVAAQYFSFKTYGALKFVKSECGYQNRCTPYDQWRIEFNNPLDAAAFKQEWITITPAAPNVRAAVYGNVISLQGVKKGNTTYQVRVDGALKDEFGQTLGSPASATFKVGQADPRIYGGGKDFLVLDPNAPARYSVYSVNYKQLKVKLYAVTPEDWYAWTAYRRGGQGYDDEESKRHPIPPGKLVSDKVVTIEKDLDEIVETRLDLTPALNSNFGSVIVIVEPVMRVRPKQRYDRETVEVWANSTDIGLDAFVDYKELYGFATSLKTGAPLGNTALEIYDGNAKQNTNDAGMARLVLPQGGNRARLLIARRGNDVSFLPENPQYWQSGTSWQQHKSGDELRWFVFDDRKLYRPGEEVHLKGWLRKITNGVGGDVESLGDAASGATYILKDSRGNEVLKGSVTLNALGGFDTSFKLPPTMNLGYAYLQFQAQNAKVNNGEFNHVLQVQEFRRPEFEVTTKVSEGEKLIGGFANITANASYYAGGGLANTDVNWRVGVSPTNYTPPNRDEWIFGKWVPWWLDYESGYGGRGGYGRGDESVQNFKGVTDAAGKHTLRVDFLSVSPVRPYNVRAEANVQDVNRQAFAASSNFLVHPSELYVGVRSARNFVQKGEPLVVQSIVTDIAGKAVVNREIRMRAVLLDYVFENGSWQQKETNEQTCNVRSNESGVECRFPTKEGGQYRITTRVIDDRERPNETEFTLWVAGGKTIPQRDVELEKIQLIPNKKDYAVGETAEILVQTPFAPAEAVLTLRRGGLVKVERFRMDTNSYTLRIPIEESYIPNIYVQVDAVGTAARTKDNGEKDDKLAPRPAFASGTLNLSIPSWTRKLSVTATPRDKNIEPGGSTVVNVVVKDAGGRPVIGSEVAVVVVDESVLSLTGYSITDPLDTFYTQRGADVSDYRLRQFVELGNPDDIQLKEQEGGGAGSGGVAADSVIVMSESLAGAPPPPPSASPANLPINGRAVARVALEKGRQQVEPQTPITVRENFNALAVFAPAVKTDADGRAVVNVKLPDNLTRYRVTAVAVAGGKLFGKGEDNITARQPLMVRPSAPRFLNFGDKFELPVVLQNQTDQPMTAEVAMRATNATLTAGAGRRVTIPANDRVEVRFPVAADKAGTARFQIAAASGNKADAAEISLPVWTPATTEAFATYGTLDGNNTTIAQPVVAPANAVKQFGGLEVTTSSTQLQELTDAVLYLQQYPYECSEQLASRIIGIAALKDVLAAFRAKELPPPDELKATVARDIKRLQGRQKDDGGFGFWRRDDEDYPYVSLHVAHALARAKAKGFDVPDEMLKRSQNYLKNIESKIPKYYSQETRWAIIAYALNVRFVGGDRDAARARKLITEAGVDKLSLEALGWLLPVISGDAASVTQLEAVRRRIANSATETAGAAHFVTAYSDGAQFLLHSNRRADGILLEALIQDQPQNDLITKLVRGLLAHKTKGRWLNTQENVFILLALDRYFNTYEKTTPDFVARVWLGATYAGEQQFRGRSTDRNNINIPMSYLAGRGEQNLLIQKDGAGRLYYRIGLNYAPADLNLKAADYGFKIERKYEAVDNPSDVSRDANGIWHVKAGARVRVRLTMTAQSRRYHVALVDPLPAGLEILNPELLGTETLPRDEGQTGVVTYGSSSYGYGYYRWRSTWFDHQNFRDERAEAFTALLWEGVYNYSYITRATTPGQFVVPPAKAEEMYMPETFGRSASDKLTVE